MSIIKPRAEHEFKLHFLDANRAITPDGLVLKHVEKTESIRTVMQVRVVAQLQSWEVCRIIRRDFNLLSSKMFFRVLNGGKEQRKVVRDLVAEMMLQGELVKCEVQENTDISDPVDPETGLPVEFEIKEVPLRLVSQETTIFYRALTNVDSAIAKLAYAYKTRVINSKEYAMVVKPYIEAYSDLKYLLVNSGYDVSTQDATALASEAGIL